MAIKLEPVKSSNIDAIGHDSVNDELHIQFKTGGTFVYPGVSAEKHAALIGADSVGKHFRNSIMPYHKGCKQ